MDLIYPCKCHGECDSIGLNLGACIMRTDKPDSYCRYCAKSIREQKEREYFRIGY